MAMPGPTRQAGGRPATARTVAELRGAVDAFRREGARVALVPTMGALHAGHAALVRAARAACGRVVASLFVNPTQFGPAEDFTAYPRDEAADTRRLAEWGVDLLYAPGLDEMYPPGEATRVRVAGLSEVLCGRHRPGHFEGVATVVAKLFAQALPDLAVFGEKDYQQLKVIERMTRDLGFPVAVKGVPTVREADGLALSSRNAYLSAAERAVAPALQRTLCAVSDRVARGEAAAAAEAWGRAALEAAGFAPVDYVALADAETLAPVERPERPARVFAAAWLGRARLIDNVPVPPGTEARGAPG